MSITVYIALFGLPLVSLALFAAFKQRRAVVWTYLISFLFLPMAGIAMPGNLSYDKVAAASLSVLAGLVLFGLPQVMSYRPMWPDLAALALTVAPACSSISNHLPINDTLVGLISNVLTWGIPYFAARVVIRTQEDVLALFSDCAVGGLIYIPFCLFEIKFSPRLHFDLYGFYQHSLAQVTRFGGFRPMVFMQHGLSVGLWMCVAAFVAYGFWRLNVTRRISRMLPRTAFWLLAITAVLCRSMGALFLLLVAVGALEVYRRQAGLRNAVLLTVIAATPLYVAARILGVMSGERIVSAAMLVSSDRADSFEFRLKNEDALVGVAREKPLFGWRTWAFTQEAIADAQPDDAPSKIVTDGLWILLYAQNGLFGICAFFAMMLGPPASAILRNRDPRARPNGLLAIGTLVVVMHVADCIPNAMLSPVYVLCAGGLCAVAGPARKSLGAAVRAARPSDAPPRPSPKFAAPRNAGGVL